MSKTLRTVAVIAGAVAVVAATGGTALAALAPAGMAGTATVAGISAATLSTVASVASAVGFAASIGAAATAKTPPARGSVSETIIAAEPPSPYIMGRTYSGGVLRHDVGYGATLKKVPNPYRAQVLVHSVAGPVAALMGIYADYAEVPFASDAAAGYYSGFLYRDYRLGYNPDLALNASLQGMPGWSPQHKLSNKAAILLNGKFDKDGKRFASGWPVMGAVWQGVATYDARKDSTYPGGSGSHRINDEATWAYSECPAQHALAYALGRFRNGKKVFGVGLPADGIVLEHFVELSNVCQANGWKIGGIAYEPGDRWANLKRILAAGGAEPLFIGGKLGLRINAPRVSIYDLTAGDLAEEDAEIPAAKTWRERRNGIRPKYRSEANRWTYVASDLVSVPSYIAEDGEEKFEELQWDFVQDKNQAAQLAAYKLVNGREIGPITLVCKPHLRRFGPGDMITLNLGADHALGGLDAVILKRSVDPATMKVTLTLETETAGKHDFALGRTGTAPPTPALVAKEDKDVIARSVLDTDTIGWTGVYEDDPLRPKPEDGATVGMTPGERDEFDQLDSDVIAAQAAIVQAQNAIAQAQADIAEITGAEEGDFGPLMQAVNDLENEVDAAQGNITGLQSTTSAIQQSVNGLQSGLSGAQGIIADIQSQVGQVGTRVDQVESSVSTLGGSVNTLQQSVTGIAGSVSTLSQTVSTHGANISTLQQALSSLDASYATLEIRVSSAEGSVTSLSQSLTNANGSISSLQQSVSSLNGSVTTLQQSSSTQAGQISSLEQSVATQGASINTNAQAITAVSGSLATLTTRVNASQSNLLAGGGLEGGFAGAIDTGGFTWTTGGAWGPYAYTNANGQHVFQFADIPSAQVGATYWISCDPIAFGSSSVYCDLLFLNSSGGVILDGGQNQQTGPFDFSTNDTRRAQIAVSAVAPTGTVKIRARVIAQVNGGQVAGFRRVKVETGPTWTPFSSEASIVQTFTAYSDLNSSLASLSTTVSSQGGAITTLQQSFTGLNGTVSSLSQTVTAQGASIGTLQSASSTQAGLLASLTTRVNASQANLLRNGGLENGFSGVIADGGFSWSASPSWGPIAATSVNGLHVFQFAAITSVQVGAKYWIACDPLAFGSSYIYCDLQFLDASNIPLDGPQNQQVGPFNFSDNDTRRGMIAVSAVAPAGTVKIIPRIVAQVNDGQPIGFRRVKVETGEGWTPFSGEATVVQTFEAISTVSGSLASLTSTVATQGASVSQNATAISTLQGQQASLSSTVSAQGSVISQLQTATATLDGNVATLATRVSAAGSNILPNGGLENGFATGVTDAGGFQFQNSNDWGPFAVAYGNGLRVFQFAPVFSPQIGGTYTFAVDPLQFGSSDVYCDILCMSGGTVLVDGAERGIAGSFNFDNSDTRRGQIACTVANVPSGTDRLICRVLGTVRDGQPIGFRRAKLENGPQWSRYSDEASVVQQFQTLSTLDTQYASLSSTVGVLGASVSQNASAISNLQGQYASLSSTVSAQGASVTQNAQAISALNGNVATLFAQYGVEIDVNGYVSGFKLNNNGSRSDFIINADRFAILKPGGGPRTEYSGGTWRVYAGSTMLIWGAAFGSSGQFVRWFGPALSDLSQCTEGNGIEYLKTNGDAYFGGSLSAGTLRNSVTGTSPGANASALLEDIGSNGHTRSIVLSYTWAFGGIVGSARSPVNPTATITLYRGKDASGTQIATLNVGPGDFSTEPASGGQTKVDTSMSGSLTVNDTSGGTTVSYFAVITARNVAAVNGVQRITIVTTET